MAGRLNDDVAGKSEMIAEGEQLALLASQGVYLRSVA